MTSLKLDIKEVSQVGEARRFAAALAQNLGFNEIETGKAAIVASEIASNLARYAEYGELIIRSLENEQVRGLELLAVDKGPGIRDVNESLRDGFSTGNGEGIGLGAIARQSNLFDLYSIPGKGTVLLARLWSDPPASEPFSTRSPFDPGETGAVCLPAQGQVVAGDSWAIDFQADRSRILLADGLGHGEAAAQAAKEAVRLFRENNGLSPAALAEMTHTALHSTRGCVMAVAEVIPGEQTIRYCGVGNISGAICTENQWHGLMSYEGIVGHTAKRFREFTYAYQAESAPLLVLHSDGLGTHWNLSLYPGLKRRHPGLIAGVLYRDYRRLNDDVTVIVTRLY
ncbi:MAG: SpoIIE family protein phosphatase [Omnitrophica WOR_2 bacterium]